jgi:hypothetical protein
MVTAAEGKGFWSSFVVNQREFNNGPLWFVQALLVFSVAYCAWRARFGATLTLLLPCRRTAERKELRRR